ncbi:hypothetical protein Tcan_11445 [Toxocara canis]|uniref:Uncharacterized protein n=1 Tax=Toxocara canis TaxID=6265 RepID=A0A0B2VUP0_TOXCA|nr:hypothetical protein Tcan_11445 [Toxocara canis]
MSKSPRSPRSLRPSVRRLYVTEMQTHAEYSHLRPVCPRPLDSGSDLPPPLSPKDVKITKITKIAQAFSATSLCY